jgi:hypothetical protein
MSVRRTAGIHRRAVWGATVWVINARGTGAGVTGTRILMVRRRNLVGRCYVVVSGGVVAFDVVVGSADRDGLLDVGERVASGLPLGTPHARAVSPSRLVGPSGSARRVRSGPHFCRRRDLCWPSSSSPPPAAPRGSPGAVPRRPDTRLQRRFSWLCRVLPGPGRWGVWGRRG